MAKKTSSSTKTAFVTGITGQDGSYLTEFLLTKNYRVVGLVRRSARLQMENIQHLIPEIEIAYGDLNDSGILTDILREYRPDEIYNFAAQSSPADSWKQPIYTADITGIGAVRLFEAARHVAPNAKIYQASTSEMYGNALAVPQTETTPFNPNNPYGAAKLYAHYMAKMYRHGYKQYIACGILFNHESPRRGPHFVTRKVARAVACIKLGITHHLPLNEKGQPLINKQGKLTLGNLDGQRDWGYAKDYVQAMWLMLQQSQPDDFVIATGQIHTIKDLCETAFSRVGLKWQDYVEVDPDFIRPLETGPLVGLPTKAKKILKWEPKTSFTELIGLMVDAELANLR